MKNRLLLAILAIGLCADLRAQEQGDSPRIAFVGPGAGKVTVTPDKYVTLVVEGSYLSFDKNPIDDAGLVEYVNNLLKAKNVSYLAVYPREGIKYGDLVRAIDVLRKTEAKNIGVSLAQLAPGREP